MNNFLSRTLTGIVFVLIMAGALWLGQVSFFVLFLLIIAGSMIEFYRLEEKKDLQPLKSLGISLGVVFFILTFFHASGQIENLWLGMSVLLFLLPAIAEIFRKKSNPSNAASLLTGIVYIGGLLSTANYIVFDPLYSANYSSTLILGIFFIIWINDTMAYVIGKYLGTHKLIQRISPKKTWEGTLAGLLFSILAAAGFAQFTPVIDTFHAFGLGGIISVAANLGDLFESSLKRSAGQKDSGKLLPGHGGILDRFDAAIFAIPFAFLYLHLVML